MTKDEEHAAFRVMMIERMNRLEQIIAEHVEQRRGEPASVEDTPADLRSAIDVASAALDQAMNVQQEYLRALAAALHGR